MVKDSSFVNQNDVEAYEAKVQVTNRSQEECDEFWERLVRESEENDQASRANQENWNDRNGIPETSAPASEQLSFDERYEKLKGVVFGKSSHREILLRVLSLCAQPQEFAIVESAIQAYPEYPTAGQNPYRLITYLIDGGGLDRLEMGFDGNALTPEIKEGLTEDEIDDLIDCFFLKTTDVGEQLANDYAPKRRLEEAFKVFGDRKPFYDELLEFCCEPRTFKDIEALFAGRDLSNLKTLNPESGLAIKPTVFVDNMEKAGAIVWKQGGWILTKEGEAYLKAMTHGAKNAFGA